MDAVTGADASGDHDVQLAVAVHVADHRVRVDVPVEQDGEAAHGRAVAMVGQQVDAR